MLRLAESVRRTQTQDGSILLDVRGGQMFSVNMVGETILELLSAGWSQEEIVATLATRFDVDHGRIGCDVTGFLQSLADHQLLEAGVERQAGDEVSHG